MADEREPSFLLLRGSRGKWIVLGGILFLLLVALTVRRGPLSRGSNYTFRGNSAEPESVPEIQKIRLTSFLGSDQEIKLVAGNSTLTVPAESDVRHRIDELFDVELGVCLVDGETARRLAASTQKVSVYRHGNLLAEVFPSGFCTVRRSDGLMELGRLTGDIYVNLVDLVETTQ